MHAAHFAHHMVKQRKEREENQSMQQEFFHAAAEGNSQAISSLLGHVNIEERNAENKTALEIASENGHGAVVRQLIAAGVSFDKEDVEGNTPLLIACQKGHLDVVIALIEKGAKSYNTNKEYLPPVCVAALAGHELIVQYLVQKGKADINWYSYATHDWPLGIAIKKNNLRAVEILVRHGARTDSYLYRKWNPESEKILQCLVKVGVDINASAFEDNTPLQYAVLHDYRESISILIRNGANPDTVTKSGSTALCLAADKGNINIIEILLANRASVNKSDSNGNTPLHIVAYKGQIDILRVLLRHKASLWQKNGDGATPLFLAVCKERLQTALCLLENRADPCEVNNNGDFPLLMASQQGYEKIAENLLNYGAEVNQENKRNGSTPLILAAHKNQENMIELLLARGAKVTEKNSFNILPLVVAAGAGHVGILSVLIKHGADVNEHSRYLNVSYPYFTPLSIAARNGHCAAVEFLLKEGANINVDKALGASPIQVAAEQGHSNIIELLLNSGKEINAEESAILLDKSIKNKDEKSVAVLLKAGVSSRQINDDAEMPLYLAANKADNENIINQLIQAGADVNQGQCHEPFNSPLHATALINNEKNMLALLNQGADVNQTNSVGLTPLHIACTNGDQNIVNLLLNKGVDHTLVAKHHDLDMTPMQMAACAGHVKVVHLLCERNSHLEQSLADQGMSLWIACNHGQISVINYLVESGISVEKNADFWEQLRFSPDASWIKMDINDIIKVVQKNMVDSAIKLTIENLEKYKSSGGGSAVTKQNKTRGSDLKTLIVILNLIKSDKNANVDDIKQALINAQELMIANKEYGWLGHTHSEYYKALEASISAIDKARTVIKNIVGNHILIPVNAPIATTLGQHTGKVRTLVLSEEALLVSGSDDKTIKVWDSETSQCKTTLSGHSKEVWKLFALPDNQLISHGYLENAIKFWDLKKNRLVKTWKNLGIVQAIAVMPPPNNRVVIYCGDNIQLWDDKGKSVIKNVNYVNVIAALSSKSFATGGEKGTIKIWDAMSGRCLQTWSGHADPINAFIAWHDGNRLASGSNNGMIKIWDPSSGKCLKVLTGHRGSINALAMLSETELVSGSSDNTIKIWDLLTEDCITLTGHSYGVYALATLPAQRLIFCGAGNGVVKLWNISEKLSLTDDKQFVKEKTSNSKAEKTEKFNESSPRTYRLRLSTNFGNLAADAVQEEEIDEKSKDLSFLL